MQRRDVLKLLTSTVAMSAIPGELLLVLQQARAEIDSSFVRRTLNGPQDALVTTISELIIPETDTPGAKGAKVNQFVDLLLSEWFEQSDRSAFLQGLGQVDAESNKRFGMDFVACKPSQQVEMMKRLDDAAMEFARTHDAADKARATSPSASFFYTFKRLTLVGYYTSEIGFKKELHKTIIPPAHAGCAPLPGVQS